jgi:DNA-binding XRE family transcriptional regulator
MRRSEGGEKVRSRTKPFLKLRAAIVEAGYTQGEIAKAIGVDISTFSQKINGHRDFTLPECVRIAKIVKKSLDDIFFSN